MVFTYVCYAYLLYQISNYIDYGYTTIYYSKKLYRWIKSKPDHEQEELELSRERDWVLCETPSPTEQDEDSVITNFN